MRQWLKRFRFATELRRSPCCIFGNRTSYRGSGSKGDAEPSIGLPVTLYLYDADGNLIKQLNPNGTEADTTIDAVDDQQTVTNKMTAGGQILSSYFYQSDLDGRKTSDTETRLNNDGSTYTTTNIAWQYDAISHLIQETYSDGVAADAYTDVYTYDLDGNRHSLTHTSGGVSQETDYSYNSDDVLQSENTFNPATGAQISSTTYGYDDNGSMISAATTTSSGTITDTYTYDARNRMISATVNGVTAICTYDDDGDRVSEAVSGTTTTYLNDANNPSGYVQVLEERRGSSLTTYVTGPRGVISQNANGIVTYLLMDGHGSTRLLTSASGQVVGEYDYDAFGNVLSLSSGSKAWANTLSTPYQFAGMRMDLVTGMDLTESRPYMPTDGRFPMADSYVAGPGDLDNANLYVYGGSDPIIITDPTGHAGLLDMIAVMGLIISVAALESTHFFSSESLQNTIGAAQQGSLMSANNSAIMTLQATDRALTNPDDATLLRVAHYFVSGYYDLESAEMDDSLRADLLSTASQVRANVEVMLAKMTQNGGNQYRYSGSLDADGKVYAGTTLINLGPSFFALAPKVQTSTLIHESSHAWLGTYDGDGSDNLPWHYVYGEDANGVPRYSNGRVLDRMDHADTFAAFCMQWYVP